MGPHTRTAFFYWRARPVVRQRDGAVGSSAGLLTENVLQIAGSNPAPAIMADDLENTIRENAQGPAEAHGDAGGMKQHGLKDQIAADKYLAGKTAVSAGPTKAFVRVKIVPPGTA